jgi:hypothetical protein
VDVGEGPETEAMLQDAQMWPNMVTKAAVAANWAISTLGTHGSRMPYLQSHGDRAMTNIGDNSSSNLTLRQHVSVPRTEHKLLRVNCEHDQSCRDNRHRSLLPNMQSSADRNTPVGSAVANRDGTGNPR